MPITPTYPGVYVEEVPSGVRTIVGVSTSIAVFIGRTKQGPLNEPILCLNFSDFDRVFSSEYAGSDLARAVRLFFMNGGTQCYVMRIAKDPTYSEVILKDNTPTKNEVLKVTAKSPGLVGDTIRLAVTYNGLNPGSTFNMEIFRWTKNSAGTPVKTDLEKWTALSMNPNDPWYVQDYVSQNSKLVKVEDLTGVLTKDPGYSQSGRAVPCRTPGIFRDNWKALIGSTATTNCFRISVDGGAFIDVDLKNIDFFSDADLDTAAEAESNLHTKIEAAINDVLQSGAAVTVSWVTGPVSEVGQENEKTKMLKISSANGDVRIEPAALNDLAVPLMLGTAQGGIEVSHYAKYRPIPTGIFFKIEDWVSFAEEEQTAFNTIKIDTTNIDLLNKLETTTTSPSNPNPRMYEDGYSPYVNGNCDGVREKWDIIAGKINDKKISDLTFKWSAEVWGSQLALIPGDGGDNSKGSIESNIGGVSGTGENINDYFIKNVRYYSLGPSGKGDYQKAAASMAKDGDPPELTQYRDAFQKLDKEVDLFNLMILPKDEKHSESTTKSLWGPASIFCEKRRAFLLMDAPTSWKTVQQATKPATGVNSLRVGLVKDHSAIFFPQITIQENGLKKDIGPSGAIAGLMARIDSSRGVWKAPAGTEADIRGVSGLELKFSDDENGVLNPQAINTLRLFPNGIVNWGARTMDGDDDFTSEYKYIPVRRTALFLEESLYRGLKWVVFEPNDEPLWSQIRLNVGAFMHRLFRQGAFQGTNPKDAYLVKCDSETTTQADINLGIVNIIVGFAPLKPAEFVIIKIKQLAGQIQA
jgi:phage tail sheath protein FI